MFHQYFVGNPRIQLNYLGWLTLAVIMSMTCQFYCFNWAFFKFNVGNGICGCVCYGWPSTLEVQCLFLPFPIDGDTNVATIVDIQVIKMPVYRIGTCLLFSASRTIKAAVVMYAEVIKVTATAAAVVVVVVTDKVDTEVLLHPLL